MKNKLIMSMLLVGSMAVPGLQAAWIPSAVSAAGAFATWACNKRGGGMTEVQLKENTYIRISDGEYVVVKQELHNKLMTSVPTRSTYKGMSQVGHWIRLDDGNVILKKAADTTEVCKESDVKLQAELEVNLESGNTVEFKAAGGSKFYVKCYAKNVLGISTEIPEGHREVSLEEDQYVGLQDGQYVIGEKQVNNDITTIVHKLVATLPFGMAMPSPNKLSAILSTPPLLFAAQSVVSKASLGFGGVWGYYGLVGPVAGWVGVQTYNWLEPQCIAAASKLSEAIPFVKTSMAKAQAAIAKLKTSAPEGQVVLGACGAVALTGASIYYAGLANTCKATLGLAGITGLAYLGDVFRKNYGKDAKGWMKTALNAVKNNIHIVAPIALNIAVAAYCRK